MTPAQREFRRRATGKVAKEKSFQFGFRASQRRFRVSMRSRSAIRLRIFTAESWLKST